MPADHTASPRSLSIPLLSSAAARRKALIAGAVAIALIAVVDWKVQPNVSLGFLYLFPILVLALFARRWHIVSVAVLCGALRELLSPLAWDDDSLARALMGLLAFVGTGLFVSELARNRRMAMEHSAQIGQQIGLREQVQEDLRALVESSPAAILTLDAQGTILLANEAAHRLLCEEDRPLRGMPVKTYLAALAAALERPRPLLRTNMECVGRRCDGEVFLAHVWFSTYHTATGVRLAAIVLDVSEELRDRETQGLGALAATSRFLFGAVSHEVRNLAAAAAVAHTNLARIRELADNEDFAALGALVAGLERVASADLRLGTSRVAESVDLQGVLDELRIVLEPVFREEGVAIDWLVGSALPPVVAEPHSLLQVFLNLAQNSLRAMQKSANERRLVVTTAAEGDGVVVRFEDTGPGVRHPEALFQPLQHGGPTSGLGLFLSRSMARSFAGDVQHEERPTGSCFAVRLARGFAPDVPR